VTKLTKDVAKYF